MGVTETSDTLTLLWDYLNRNWSEIVQQRPPYSASDPLRIDRSLSRLEIIASDRGMSLLLMLIPKTLVNTNPYLFEIEYK